MFQNYNQFRCNNSILFLYKKHDKLFRILFENIQYNQKKLRFYQNDKNFNLFKMHNLIYYTYFIREFDVLFFVNIAIYKINYIDYFKKSFKRTNKRLNYEKQLLTYDT